MDRGCEGGPRRRKPVGSNMIASDLSGLQWHDKSV